MHERRFSRAVVADEPDAFAGTDMKVDATERADGAEVFFGAVQPDDVCASLRHLSDIRLAMLLATIVPATSMLA
jgi:hypothetical protein